MKTRETTSRSGAAVLLPTLLLLLGVIGSPAAQADHYVIEIYKSSRELLIKEGDDIVREFRVAFGKGGAGMKRQSGDNKTPVGEYKIVEFKEDSKFHFFMHLNYPNSRDAWHGYMNQLIDGREFKEIVAAAISGALPPQDTSLGGYIGLHGIGDLTAEKVSIHENHNWTEGCIALSNEEIIELRQYVTRGTPVLIRESRQ